MRPENLWIPMNGGPIPGERCRAESGSALRLMGRQLKCERAQNSESNWPPSSVAAISFVHTYGVVPRITGYLDFACSVRALISWGDCLLQGIRSLGRFCCPVAFCKRFHDYFGSTVSARLFDNCDDTLFAHPFSAVCVIFYAIHIDNRFGVAF